MRNNRRPRMVRRFVTLLRTIAAERWLHPFRQTRKGGHSASAPSPVTDSVGLPGRAARSPRPDTISYRRPRPDCWRHFPAVDKRAPCDRIRTASALRMVATGGGPLAQARCL